MSDQLPERIEPQALPHAEREALVTARVAFAEHGRFYAQVFYDMLEEYLTYQIPTLATDAKRIFINPKYFLPLKPMERAFAMAHETVHTILKHPQLVKRYMELGKVGNLPFDRNTLNIAMDLIINANLIKDGIGTCNPEWLHDPSVATGDESVEEVYRRIYSPGPAGPGGTPGPGVPPGPRKHGKGSVKDKVAEANNGRFDEVMEAAQDKPSEMEFKQAIASAAAVAKAAGTMPGSMERVVRDILEPQVDWRDHLRFTITGKIGHRKSDWTSPNRRRIVLNPIVYLPGKSGHGCNDVTVVIDNSGSIGGRELSLFFAEAGAILADCKPRQVRVIWCDAVVRRVEEARSLDELAEIREKGSKGGGGTDFRPPFEWLSSRAIRPDTLIYLTDMLGAFPSQAPGYPVVWVATTDITGPFGETVRIKP